MNTFRNSFVSFFERTKNIITPKSRLDRVGDLQSQVSFECESITWQGHIYIHGDKSRYMFFSKKRGVHITIPCYSEKWLFCLNDFRTYIPEIFCFVGRWFNKSDYKTKYTLNFSEENGAHKSDIVLTFISDDINAEINIKFVQCDFTNMFLKDDKDDKDDKDN